MSTTDQRTAKIALIADCPRALHDAVKGLSDEQLDTPYRDGGWTVRQVIHHVADSHVNAYLRFRWTVTEDHPTLKAYDQDVWATLPDTKLPLAPSFSIIDGIHTKWTTFLSALP
ncbi:MAG TPA: DinB family protein, partial [Gemmatimonadaceae bacterium]